MGRRTLVWMLLIVLLLTTVLAACSQGEASHASTGRASTPPEGILLIDARSVKRTGGVPKEGTPAPDFAFVADDGTTYTLSDLRGHPIVINFWATWCPPCRMEMPALNAAHEAYREQGLILLAVNEMDDRESVEAFRKGMNVSLPMLLDTRGIVGRTYLVRGLPTTFFVDAQGNIAVRWTGMLTETDLETNLQAILGEQARAH